MFITCKTISTWFIYFYWFILTVQFHNSCPCTYHWRHVADLCLKHFITLLFAFGNMLLISYINVSNIKSLNIILIILHLQQFRIVFFVKNSLQHVYYLDIKQFLPALFETLLTVHLHNRCPCTYHWQHVAGLYLKHFIILLFAIGNMLLI